MPAITGAQYVSRIDELKNNIWIDGARIRGKLSVHPAFKGILESQAALYHMQHEEALQQEMLFRSPTTGEAVGMSFLQPKTKEDLVKRRKMVQHYASFHHGLMGRSPDYMNTVVTAFACSLPYLQGYENCYPEHLQSFYERAREQDLSITHTFIDPQVNRAAFYDAFDDKPIAATIVEQRDDGIVVDGAKLLATQGGMTDELFVMSGSPDGDRNRAFAFAIPSNTQGVKFICRQSFVLGDNMYDYPLSAKFDEIDALVRFDRVFIPWERVFYACNVQVANTFAQQSLFRPLTLHQVVTRQIQKTEFFIALAKKLVDCIQIGAYAHVQQKIVELLVLKQTLEALLLKAEHYAYMHENGYMCPQQQPLEAAIIIYPQMYPRMVEIIQQLGASGLVNLPTENTVEALHHEVDHFFQSKVQRGKERIALFRLAWDLTMSPFGTRQTLYERYFFGDPERMAGILYHLA